jgi:hypothetical protein
MEKDGLPETLRPFFWDADFHRLSTKKDAFSIISRLLELGDETAIKFLFRMYKPEEMISVLRSSRSLSSRSRRFWTLFFNAEDQPCTPNRYPTPFGNCSRD